MDLATIAALIGALAASFSAWIAYLEYMGKRNSRQPPSSSRYKPETPSVSTSYQPRQARIQNEIPVDIRLHKFLAIVLGILMPPLGIIAYRGFKIEVVISIVLTLLGYIPGIVHMVWVVGSHNNPDIMLTKRQISYFIFFILVAAIIFVTLTLSL